MGFFNKLILYFIHKPGVSLGLSFACVILIGAVFLMFPAAIVSDEISFLDALFTATSAVSVTGLIVKDTPVFFSRFGQIVILVLMQIGALGVMTGAAMFLMMIRKKINIVYQATLRRTLVTEFVTEAFSLVKFIFIITFLFEIVGAALLFLYWDVGSINVAEKFFYAVFHSVSAFANAGFSLFSDSFYLFKDDLPFNLIIMSLIVIGGLGFMVLLELKNFLFGFKNGGDGLRKIHVHTRVVILVTLILIILGAVGLLIFEKNNPDFGANPTLVSYFQSVTTRTAGFSTVDVSSLSSPTYLMFIVLMFIGGGAGSTAGGIKVTTIAIVVLIIWSFIRNRKEVSVFGRTLPLSNVKRAVVIFSFSLFTLVLFSILLLYTEDAKFYEIIFEAVSAFGTVGLSTGITASLTSVGKIFIIILMFVGRIGPLTIALVTAREEEDSKIKYPHERIIVG